MIRPSRPIVASPRYFPKGTLWVCLLAAWVFSPMIVTDWKDSPERWIPILCYATTIQFVLQLRSWKRVSGTLFDPYAVFLTAATLFNAGRALLASLPGNSFETGFAPDIALHAMYIIGMALCALHLGGLIAFSGPQVCSARRRSPFAVRASTLRSVGGLMILVAIAPLSMLMYKAVSGVMQEGYAVALYTNDAATSFAATPSVLAAFIVPGAFLLLAGSVKKAGTRTTSIIIVALYAGTLLFIGWRAAALSVAIGYTWLWHRCVRHVPRALIVSLGALLLVILPAVAAMRNLTGQDRVSLSTLSQSVRNAGALSAIEEMGGIWDTVAHTITLVPSERPYDYGASYGLSALTVFPNLFWTVHPAISKGSPQTWLVQRVAPWTAARGGGLGFSFIAEAYLNFGSAGCVIVLFSLGFLLAKAVRWADAIQLPLGFALVAASLTASLKYVRADSFELVRPLVCYAILPCLLVVLFSRRGKANTSGRVLMIATPAIAASSHSAVKTQRLVMVRPLDECS